jgi:deoxyribose-phosphate aldolase
MNDITENSLVRSIDQTNLNPAITAPEISSFIQEAKEYGFFSIAIMPSWIPLATDILQGGNTTIVAAIGYPMGTCTTSSKVAETRWAIKNGPKDIEIDMVMNVPLLKSGKYDQLEKDIIEVVNVAESHVVKVILEVPILTKQEVVIASLISERAGVDFVKTSTGFKPFRGWRPSTVDDVKLIRSAVDGRIKVKVAGGISTLSQAISVLQAGASRIGTSSGVTIMKEYKKFCC